MIKKKYPNDERNRPLLRKRAEIGGRALTVTYATIARRRPVARRIGFIFDRKRARTRGRSATDVVLDRTPALPLPTRYSIRTSSRRQ